MRRRAAAWAVLGIIMAQAAVLLVCAADPLPGWAGRPLPPELWAMNRRWQFHLLMAVWVVGPIASVVLAWRRAPRWWWLVLSWPTFAVVLLTYHERRVSVMLTLISERLD